MKIILSVEMKKEEVMDLLDKGDLTDTQLKNYLIHTLFEICDDWVLKGQQPDFEVEE